MSSTQKNFTGVKANKKEKNWTESENSRNKSFMCLVKKEKNKLRNFAILAFVRRSQTINLWVYWIFLKMIALNEISCVIDVQVCHCEWKFFDWNDHGIFNSFKSQWYKKTIRNVWFNHEKVQNNLNLYRTHTKHILKCFFYEVFNLNSYLSWLLYGSQTYFNFMGREFPSPKKTKQSESDKFHAIFPTHRK
jgi:hypothetical protein